MPVPGGNVMKDYMLETCVDSVESAVAAEKGGARRLELCANLVIGGTTPGVCLYKEVRKKVTIPIHVLIRPRFGDFCYTDYEFEIIKEEVRMFHELGADGIVIGILKPDGTLNQEQLRQLIRLAPGMSVTLHRAFDVCVDPKKALEEAAALGFHTILTSGQENNCLTGAKLLGELEEQSAGRIVIQVGSGVSAEAIKELYPKTGAKAYHMSGKVSLDSSMKYRKENVNMGLPSLGEFEIWRTQEEKICEAKMVLEEL
jgi:copper homeostasis protein